MEGGKRGGKRGPLGRGKRAGRSGYFIDGILICEFVYIIVIYTSIFVYF